MTKKIEYRVRPVQRYVITRYEEESREGYGSNAGSEPLGEFDNWERAIDIAQRLASSEEGAKYIGAEQQVWLTD